MSEAKTRAEAIREELADDIARGRIAPGVALEEVGLANRFGVSRTPIREAIRQLEAIGFAEARPRRGAVVARITQQRLDEMFAVMAEMEGLCARLAAAHMSAPDRVELRRIHAETRKATEAGDIEAYNRLNTDFHALIYAGTHNSYLEEIAANVRLRVAPYRRAQFWSAGRLDLSYREHDAVVEAILAEDPDAAAAAMKLHIGTVRVAVDSVIF